jgi:hypothetical protein
MFNPDPSLFYQIMCDVFGNKATFATRAVSKIEVVKGDHPYCQSLCIDKNGIIMVNIDFWRKNIKTYSDAKIVLIHELFHAVLGDHVRLKNAENYEKQLYNFSMDMRINAAIIGGFVQDTTHKNVLTEMYPSKGPAGLLRPGSKYGANNKFSLIYSALYPRHAYDQNHDPKRQKDIFRNEETLRNALKILMPPEKIPKTKIVFLGNHSSTSDQKDDGSGQDGEDEGESQEIPQIDESLKEEIAEAILGKYSGQGIGSGNILYENFIQVIKASRSVRMQAFEKYACSAKINTLKSLYIRERRTTSVYPLRPSHRDLARVAAGDMPVLWNNIKETKSSVNRNVAIYLDVSGSVNEHLPEILGVIAALRQSIQTVFCFSNKVSTHTTQELLQGKFNTTGGTDFDCVIEHALENKVDKFICFTDGWANANSKTQEEAKKKIKDVAVVYFGSSNYDNFFCEQYGKSFKIEDLY